MAWYPYPTNLTNFLDIFGYNNTVTGGLFGVSIVIVLFIVLFVISSLRFPKERALTGSSFITMMLTIFLYLASIVKEPVLMATVAIFLISVLYLFIRKRYT